MAVLRQSYLVLRQSENRDPRRVAILLGNELGYCRRVLSGVLRFAGERSDWLFRDGPPDHELLAALTRWQPDGIIAHLYDRHLAGGLSRIGCPVVSTTDTLPSSEFPLVDVDNRQVGLEAARYFLRRGFRNFGYFGSGTAMFSKQREAGFREQLREAGIDSVSTHHAEFLPKAPGADPWRSVGKRAEDWIESLPKPVAIFCSNDLPARRVGEVCNRGGFKIPDEVALLGVDNDTSECRLSTPHLSSIDTPAEGIGYEAARMLAALMEDREMPEEKVFLPPLHVVTRSSTDRLACSHPVVLKSLQFIRDQISSPVNVDIVAQHAGVSRRKLERLFRSELNRSILSVIHETKTAFARELLSSTSLRVSEIADRCGFGNAKRLHSIFRDQTGFSPDAYRKKTGSTQMG